MKIYDLFRFFNPLNLIFVIVKILWTPVILMLWLTFPYKEFKERCKQYFKEWII